MKTKVKNLDFQSRHHAPLLSINIYVYEVDVVQAAAPSAQLQLELLPQRRCLVLNFGNGRRTIVLPPRQGLVGAGGLDACSENL